MRRHVPSVNGGAASRMRGVPVKTCQPVWAVTVIMLVMCIFAAFEARRGMALDPSRRARFMGLSGLIISASFFLDAA